MSENAAADPKRICAGWRRRSTWDRGLWVSPPRTPPSARSWSRTARSSVAEPTAPGGRPHAEPIAIDAAGEAARGATLYVTLEPCSHVGRSPPCADAIVEAGVARVVSAMEDPNPQVKGRGHARLRQAGIDVSVGACAAQARRDHRGHILAGDSGAPMRDAEARRDCGRLRLRRAARPAPAHHRGRSPDLGSRSCVRPMRRSWSGRDRARRRSRPDRAAAAALT